MSPRTFSIERGALRPKVSFDDEVWFVRADPLERKSYDGTTSVSMGFPVLAITGWVAEPGKLAAKLAALLTMEMVDD